VALGEVLNLSKPQFLLFKIMRWQCQPSGSIQKDEDVHPTPIGAKNILASILFFLL
jgi:hypothetical protein